MGLRSDFFRVVLRDLPTSGSVLKDNDPRFDELMGGRIGAGKWKRYEYPFGTNCGVTTAGWMIDAGVPASLINALPPQGSGFTPGAHLSRMNEGAKALGWYRTPTRGQLPTFRPGDVYMINHGDGSNSHVGVVVSVTPSADGRSLSVETADGGQGGRTSQEISRQVRTFSLGTGAHAIDYKARYSSGWLDNWIAIGGDAPDDVDQGPSVIPGDTAPEGSDGDNTNLALGALGLGLLGLGVGAYWHSLGKPRLNALSAARSTEQLESALVLRAQDRGVGWSDETLGLVLGLSGLAAGLGVLLWPGSGAPAFGGTLGLRTAAGPGSVRTSFGPKAALHFVNNFPDSTFAGVSFSGLCGGMAFTALDYYHAGVTSPTTTQTPHTDQGIGLYVHDRQQDSLLGSNGLRFAGLLVNPSDDSVAEITAEELVTLKASLDRGVPVPIGLVPAPWTPVASDAHQVVATGYRVDSSGTTVYVWDPNAPNVASSLRQAAGSTLWQETGGTKDQWRGFFVEAYDPKPPPGAPGYTGPDPGIVASVTDAVANLFA